MSDASAAREAGPGIACLAGTADPDFQPSVLQLLEWYEVFVAEMVDRDPDVAEDATNADHQALNIVTHVPPFFIPRIDILRALYEDDCRGATQDHTERQTQFHIRCHEAGWTHN
jgi:hypothetical protein